MSDVCDYAEYRGRYDRYVQNLHLLVLAQESLCVRLLLDAVFFKVFSEVGLDWYGKLYSLKPRQFILPNSDILHDELQSIILSWSEMNMSELICLFLDRCTSTLAYYKKLYLRNIFALDSSLKYFINCTFIGGMKSEQVISECLISTILNAIEESNRTEIAELQSSSPRDVYMIERVEFIELLSHFMKTEEHEQCASVQAPTLIFHFRKKGINNMLEYAIQSTSYWFGSNREPNHYLSQQDIDEINSLKRNQISDNERLALRYGIGVHMKYSQQGQDYLALVERLFLNGKLKFVISTSTLSYGINMPATNVIFIGTSPFLDGMMFRQCAGNYVYIILHYKLL
jgi:hypothetical protein